MSQAKNGAYGLIRKCPQSWIPSGGFRQQPISSTFSASRRHLHSTLLAPTSVFKLHHSNLGFYYHLWPFYVHPAHFLKGPCEIFFFCSIRWHFHKVLEVRIWKSYPNWQERSIGWSRRKLQTFTHDLTPLQPKVAGSVCVEAGLDC